MCVLDYLLRYLPVKFFYCFSHQKHFGWSLEVNSLLTDEDTIVDRIHVGVVNKILLLPFLLRVDIENVIRCYLVPSIQVTRVGRYRGTRRKDKPEGGDTYDITDGEEE